MTRLIEQLQPYTLNDPMRLSLLYGLAREICESKLAGDIVECGVCKGGSAALMATAIAHCPNHRIWLYDTFEGMPPPGPKDAPLAKTETGRLAVGTEPLLTLFHKIRFPQDRMVLRKGLFRDTFREPLPSRIALLHIDADWHDSVLSALQTFYPAVVDGGWIVLDDFGHWEGARRAFYDFCRTQSVEPLLERVGYTQALWCKGRETNRETVGAYCYGIYQPGRQPVSDRPPHCPPVET